MTEQHDWWSAVQARACALGLQEYQRQRAAWLKSGRSARTFRYTVPDWQRDVVEALGRCDEAAAKAAVLSAVSP